ncbi:uncharacterized protein LOC125777805 [Bactrocera dorsalis]|uniref:Uncharacterized protein LOC125777805 n=1 Tax=Bactrocera dorsalis TaxID=27457 RepID=A0ABM3JJR9_BACDO|nr:uncharacterized protein LOC125777805 [Bactrocera dorsalis]
METINEKTQNNNNSSNKFSGVISQLTMTGVDPFKKASRLARSPVKVLSAQRPVRSKSSPPTLQENTPILEEAESKRDHMCELGDMIKKLKDMMHPPQRTINNPIRELLGEIVKLYTRAQDDHNRQREANLARRVVMEQTTAEVTPKRPRDTQTKRRTPPKRTKTTHDGPFVKAVERNLGGGEKDATREDTWITIPSKSHKNKSKKKENAVPRPRPEAIVIAKTGDMSYADILRAVKQNENLQVLGENVSRIKKTAKGEILLELKKAQTGSTKEYRDEIVKILGDQAQIRSLTQEITVEVRDLDDITTKEDIAQAIRTEFEELRLFSVECIKNIRPAYAGTQKAIISLQAQEAKHLLAAQKIKIGWTICRIREKAQLKKCFRCLEYGHVAKACSNPEDRSKCCIKCGEEGHFAKDCVNNPSCKASAQDLLTQNIYENEIDVALICEQYKNKDSDKWISDTTKKVAIWACGDKMMQDIPLIGKAYYTRAKIWGIYFYSCYIPPSIPHAEYEKILDDLVKDAMTTTPNIIAGDFNAWALEWGSKNTNLRGSALLKAFSVLDVVLLNTGRQNTFEKNGRGSIIDISFANRVLYRYIDWRICDMYTQSDHLAIMLSISKSVQQRNVCHQKVQSKGWRIETLDEELYKLMLDENLNVNECDDIDQQAKLMVQHISKACDAAMNKKRTAAQRKPAYWWNREIESLRSESHKARRRFQRNIGSLNCDSLREAFKKKRNDLKKAIKKSKMTCFKELCEKVDENPWGAAYKIVMSRIKGGKCQAPTCPSLLKNVVETLFPQQNQEEGNYYREEAADVPEITEQEVVQAAERFKNSKAPGLDGIPNRALKIAISYHPQPFSDLYTRSLREGVFPKIWKVQRLVLLQKPNKPAGEPSSYRPLCMIDTMGKILERIICTRLENHLEGDGGLSDNQYGFRKRRSTLDAIKKVAGIAEKAIEGDRWMYGNKEYCAVVTFDTGTTLQHNPP